MEWCMLSSGKYKIECLTAATIPGAFNVIREAFFEDEPVCIATEINVNPAAGEELLELCADAALDGVSLVAVEVETGTVAAVAFNKLQVAGTNPAEKPFFQVFAEERCKYEPSRTLIKFMQDIDEKCNLFDKFGVDCSLEIMFLATLKEHRRKNLANLLCKHSIELAKKLKDGPFTAITIKDLGPKYLEMKPRSATNLYPKICQAIWTAKGSQKIGQNLNFKVHVREGYENITYNGKCFSDKLKDVAEFCELAAIQLY